MGHTRAGSSRKCSDFAKLPSLFVFTLLSTQTSRLKNSQDATVTEMRAKSERTAARLRAETQAFVTEKVRTYGHDCFRPDRDRGVCGTECSPSPAKFSPSLRRGRSLSPTPHQSKQKKEVGRQRGGLKRRKHSKQDCGEEVENEIGFGLNRVQPRRLVGHHFVFVFTLFFVFGGVTVRVRVILHLSSRWVFSARGRWICWIFDVHFGTKPALFHARQSVGIGSGR